MNNEFRLPPALVDIFTNSESIFEQKLCISLIMDSDYVLKITEGYFPEINQAVKEYWDRIVNCKHQLLEMSHDEQVEFCLKLIFEKNPKAFWRWWKVLGSENSYEGAKINLANIKALRIARKSLQYLQNNKIIENVYRGYGW